MICSVICPPSSLISIRDTTRGDTFLPGSLLNPIVGLCSVHRDWGARILVIVVHQRSVDTHQNIQRIRIQWLISCSHCSYLYICDSDIKFTLISHHFNRLQDPHLHAE